MRNEIIENQEMKDYLDDPAIGSGSLKRILTESPKDYRYALTMPAEEANHLAKGTMTHTFFHERELFEKEYIIQPEDWGPLNRLPGKKLWDEFKKKATEQGKKPIKWSDGNFLLRLGREMSRHQPLQEILSDFKAEVSFYAEKDGIEIKSREDIWQDKLGNVWDVKTCSKAMDDESLSKVIFNNGYHFSAIHHMTVMELCGKPVNRWGWIFVSTGTPAPHIVIKEASESLLGAGRMDWKHAFSMLKDCTSSGNWPGYSDEIEEISLPEWAERYY